MTFFLVVFDILLLVVFTIAGGFWGFVAWLVISCGCYYANRLANAKEAEVMLKADRRQAYESDPEADYGVVVLDEYLKAVRAKEKCTCRPGPSPRCSWCEAKANGGFNLSGKTLSELQDERDLDVLIRKLKKNPKR